MSDTPALFVSLYTDEDVTNQLAALIRQRGYQAVSAIDLGLIEVLDEEHLIYTAANNMTLFTYNEADYVGLARKWTIEGRSHTGILISDQFSCGRWGICCGES